MSTALSREGIGIRVLSRLCQLTDINVLWYESRARLCALATGAAAILCRTFTSHKGASVSGTDIFLSYARRDRPTARVIADSLSGEGFTVWWDASLHSGETFDEVIERNLKEAKAVVVLWSPASVASRWVRAEATLADRRNKLVPAIIETCDRPIIFELTHTADLTDWKGDRTDVRWRTFMEDLDRHIKAAEAQSDTANEAESRIPIGGKSARQPLRPGNHEVIRSDGTRRDTVEQQPAPPVAAAPSDSDVHCLEIEEGDLPEEVIVIGSGGAKIGRVAPADIVIPHRSVSREHCIVGIANDELLVTDLNSTNGTFIDDVRISRATVLPVGSTLRVGQISMTHSVQGHPLRNRGRPGSGQMGRFAAAS